MDHPAGKSRSVIIDNQIGKDKNKEQHLHACMETMMTSGVYCTCTTEEEHKKVEVSSLGAI